MSSRALRRLQQDAEVIRVPAGREEVEDDEDRVLEENPGFVSTKSAINPFAVVIKLCSSVVRLVYVFCLLNLAG